MWNLLYLNKDRTENEDRVVDQRKVQYNVKRVCCL